MKYKPSRDIPHAVKQLNTLSPTKIRTWIMEHRTRKDPKTGYKTQHVVGADSITNWLTRHPEVKRNLTRHVHQEEIVEEGVSEGLFQNGTFQRVPCVNEWIIQLRTRGAKEKTIKHYYLAQLRRMCQGILRGRGKNVVTIEGWGLRHPRNLSLENCQYYISELQRLGHPTRTARLTARNFLKSKGIVIREDQITGRLEEDAGKYADLHTSRENIHKIFDWLRPLNEEAYLASKFGYKTATRLTATLNADASFVNKEDHTILVLEKASKGKKKSRVPKEIPSDLWKELEPRIERGGQLFDIEPDDLNNLLRSAYEQVIPQLNKRIPMPFHFWRHMFAQQMLRATGWNTSLVAKLGGWTTGALEKYYGKMSPEVAREHGLPHLNAL